MTDTFELFRELDARGDGWPADQFLGTTEIVDFAYGDGALTTTRLPIDEMPYVNDTDGAGSVTWSGSTDTKATVRWSVTQAVQSTQSISLKFPLPVPIIGNVDTTVQDNHQATVTKVEDHSNEFSQHWQWSFNQQLPKPRQRYEIRSVIDDITHTTPFTARAIFKGQAHFLKIGFGKADETRDVNIGDLFTAHPDSRVTVLDPVTISVPIAGVLSGHFGTRHRIEIHQFDVNAPAAEQQV